MCHAGKDFDQAGRQDWQVQGPSNPSAQTVERKQHGSEARYLSKQNVKHGSLRWREGSIIMLIRTVLWSSTSSSSSGFSNSSSCFVLFGKTCWRWHGATKRLIESLMHAMKQSLVGTRFSMENYELELFRKDCVWRIASLKSVLFWSTKPSNSYFRPRARDDEGKNSYLSCQCKFVS